MDFKETAWNDISINVPLEWEISRVGARHLVFEDDLGLTMEMKWRKVEGRFIADAQLKRLSARQHGNLKAALKACPPPAEWEAALEGFEVNGFEWKKTDATGQGILVFCPRCRTAALIQFFNFRQQNPASSLYPQILQSFKDHRTDGLRLWAVFDMKVLLPEHHDLLNYSFKPGCFKLDFEIRSILLSIYRWAPAAALLADQTLADFAVTVSGRNQADFRPHSFAGHPAVRWREETSLRWHPRFFRRSAKPRVYLGQVWFLEARNRILGVQAQDVNPIADHWLDQICESYEVI